MEERLIVFISSRINDEMRQARQVVREAIEELPLTRAWLFEESLASAGELEESYLRWVGKCDLFILLLGEDIIDPVRTEWETATQARKPRLVFLKKGAQNDEARQFAKGLGLKWKEYETLAGLKCEVQAAVGDELIKGYRAYGVSEQEKKKLEERIQGLRAQAGIVARTIDTGGGAVVVGPVRVERGDFVGRDKIVYQGPSTPPPESDLEQAYLAHLKGLCETLQLGAIDPEYSDPSGKLAMTLAQVYTALDTTTLERETGETHLLAMARGEKVQRVSAQAVVNGHDRALMLGDPGSGKSTFVNHLALRLAGARLEQDRD